MRPSRQVRPLSRTEVEDLDQTYRVTNSADVRSRCQIILLSNEGYSPSEIAHVVRFSEDTVLRWIAQYEAEGRATFVGQPRPGRPPHRR